MDDRPTNSDDRQASPDDRDRSAVAGTWPGELPEDVAVASLVAEVAAALRMARWGGHHAVPRKPRAAPVQERAPAGATSTAGPTSSAVLTGTAGPARPLSAPGPSRPSAPAATGAPAVPSLAHLTSLISRRPQAQEAMDLVRAEALGCAQCPRSQLRQGVVFGTGNPAGKVLVLLGTPTAAEDAAARPGAGAEGALLDKMLVAIGLGWEDVWVTHVCLCRGDLSAPDAQQTKACSVWLGRQWEVVKPKALLAFGQVPAQFLLRQQRPMDDLRGKWFHIRNVPAMCTWSAQELLAEPGRKRQAWDDLKTFAAHLRS